VRPAAKNNQLVQLEELQPQSHSSLYASPARLLAKLSFTAAGGGASLVSKFAGEFHGEAKSFLDAGGLACVSFRLMMPIEEKVDLYARQDR
jgi:hypothetical protein